MSKVDSYKGKLDKTRQDLLASMVSISEHRVGATEILFISLITGHGRRVAAHLTISPLQVKTQPVSSNSTLSQTYGY